MNIIDEDCMIDTLAGEAGGYFALPSEEDKEWTNLFFFICRKYGIQYAHASPKQKYFVDEVVRVTWENMQKKQGKQVVVHPAFVRQNTGD